MLINVNKSCCLRIGPRSNAPCTSIPYTTGGSLPWVEELRYLGVFMKRSRVFKCSLDHAKKRFLSCCKCYTWKSWAYNIRRNGITITTLLISRPKCIPILLYVLEPYPLGKSDLSSLDFVINRFLWKCLTQSSNMDIVKSCQFHFNFDMPSILWSNVQELVILSFLPVTTCFAKLYTAPSHENSLWTFAFLVKFVV